MGIRRQRNGDVEMRYAVYVSGSAGNPCRATRFCKFLRQSDPNVRAEIKLVFADERLSEEMEDLLRQCGTPVCVFPFSELKGGTRAERNRILSDRLNAELKRHEIDYCFSFGSHILAGPLLEDYKWRLINFHPAVLPMFPGMMAIDQAIAHGNVLLVGNTCHFIDSGVDTGPIIMQSVVPLKTFLIIF